MDGLRDRFCGSLASPAVIPISSVPEKAKLTVSIVVNTPPKPLGNQPFLVRLLRPAAVNSEPKAIVQVNQYKIATKKPVAGPK